MAEIPEEAPITCQWCRNKPTAQLVIVDWSAIGRRESLVCDPCGDKAGADAATVDAMVWRYRLAPIKESVDLDPIPATDLTDEAKAHVDANASSVAPRWRPPLLSSPRRYGERPPSTSPQRSSGPRPSI